MDAQGTRGLSNVIRVHEIAAQKRFRVHATQTPAMVGVVGARGKKDEPRTLTIRSFVNRHSFAHGFQAGDLVRVTACPADTCVRVDAQDEETVLTPSAAAFPPAGLCCVVVDSASSDPSTLRLRVPAIDGLLGEVGVGLTIAPYRMEPFNLAFCKEGSVPSTCIGFPRRAVEWGADGSICDGSDRRVPPFDAPYVHNLDHPDAVLITFSEQGGAGFEHTHSGETKPLFAKLVCSPLLREERMLPRDTTAARQPFEVSHRLWNPDFRSPYHFHGAEFTFSLTFVSAVPE